jgi:hypothetical protein
VHIRSALILTLLLSASEAPEQTGDSPEAAPKSPAPQTEATAEVRFLEAFITQLSETGIA